MKMTEALKELSKLDLKGRSVFLSRDLRTIFHKDGDKAFTEGLRRLVDQGILTRAARGVYVYGLSSQPKTHILEKVASFLRRGEYNYLSLESALSEYGRISQIPIDRITVMTTGRKGEIETVYGTIEFTHTSRSVDDILTATLDAGRPLRLAKEATALRDLVRVGRNIGLVLEEDIDPDLNPDQEPAPDPEADSMEPSR